MPTVRLPNRKKDGMKVIPSVTSHRYIRITSEVATLYKWWRFVGGGCSDEQRHCITTHRYIVYYFRRHTMHIKRIARSCVCQIQNINSDEGIAQCFIVVRWLASSPIWMEFIIYNIWTQFRKASFNIVDGDGVSVLFFEQKSILQSNTFGS